MDRTRDSNRMAAGGMGMAGRVKILVGREDRSSGVDGMGRVVVVRRVMGRSNRVEACCGPGCLWNRCANGGGSVS